MICKICISESPAKARLPRKYSKEKREETAKQELLTSLQKILWKDAQIDFENITLLYFSITFEGGVMCILN